MPRSAYDDEIREWRKRAKNTQFLRQNAEWRRKWRAAGPILFALQVLKVDPNTGGALVVSEDQEEFLIDIWKNNVRLIIITAGRGAGKTFILAVYITWRIFTHDNWGISTMGGSREQSEKIHSYIVGWIKGNDELYVYSKDMVSKSRVGTVSGGEVTFHSCSGTSVRGPHTHELIIDEQASGEEAGGTQYIEAAIWEVSTSPDIHIIKSSTAHFVHGDFLKTWNGAEKLGYKKYRWSIAKHVSGEKDPYLTYQDRDPKNWSSNVPWIPDLNIKLLRNAPSTSDDKWLVEALGGISISSGLVLNPNDVKACVCSRCRDEGGECYPYREGHCPIVQYMLQLEGVRPKYIPTSTTSALKRFVKERIEGIDYGDVAPCAYTAVGRFRGTIFTLGSLEMVGLSDEEKIEEGAKMAEKWNCDIIRPDPSHASYNNALAEKGFAIHVLFGLEGGKEKREYIYTLKGYVERHKLVIPCAFEDLIRSLMNLAYDKKGKVRKQDDHSFDSLLYAVSYYGELAQQGAFWKVMREQRKTEVSKKKLERVPEEFEEPIDFFGEVAKRKRRKKKGRSGNEEDDEDKYPFGEGVNLWESG